MQVRGKRCSEWNMTLVTANKSVTSTGSEHRSLSSSDALQAAA